MRMWGFSAIGLLAAAGAQAAECRVTDPTGTPLNVRTAPNGRVVGTLVNGQRVSVLERRMIGGKAWVYVGDVELGDQPIGWVFREFVSCYGR
ncbi:SH3 domain-containing protein [Methylobacterium sp. C25]|uniref:SH3 domain-containing protein n=1 Tax=Methylobacterium sp. C25 TaxID=2721622 RepID=UPI001F3EE23D|nr:SH3 domain-containing protein [Methylobacterium sp. C25]MCE4222712.1 SH3 domain-containing protein [Methylobacterium sp. C25]